MKVLEEQLILDVFEITLQMLTGHYNGSDNSVGLELFWRPLPSKHLQILRVDQPLRMWLGMNIVSS